MKLAMQRAIVVISDLIQETNKDDDGWGKAMGGGGPVMAGGEKIDAFKWLQIISGNKEKEFDEDGNLIDARASEEAVGAPGSPGFAERGMLTDLKKDVRDMKKEMGEVKELLRKLAAKDDMPSLG